MPEEKKENIESTSQQQEEEKTPVIHGGRNLMILGIGSIIIALITTSISLFMYRSSGDIYLDRSRPGFISDGEKHDDEYEGNEDFSNEGEIDKKALNEYLDELNSINDRLRAHDDNFSEDQLSDDALGIYPFTDEE